MYNTHVAKLSLSVRRRAVKSSFLSMCDAGMLVKCDFQPPQI